jgi:LuxR family transcriptional regulator, glucitol operon activator
MAYGAVRLTLYALITAIESDLRHIIVSDLLIGKEPKDILPPETYRRARDRMMRDGEFHTDSDIDPQIIEYLDFSECIEVLASFKASLSGSISKAVQRIARAASQLTPIRNRVMHSRPLEYDDLARVTNLTTELMSFPAANFPALRQTEQLIKKDSSYVFSLTLDELSSDAEKVSHNLPIPDFDETGFLGRTDEEPQLLKICKSSPWPVITVLGEGGVGKTALALKVAYNLLDDNDAGFDAVVWSTSKTTQLTPSDGLHPVWLTPA